MLETYLGPARFREGIRLYLKRHSYSNTETTDLWDAIEEATGEPVRAIMDSWIFQGGHPLVSVTQSGGRVTLSQQRFRYLDGSDRSAALWQVPVLLRPLDRDEPARTLLSAGSASLGFDDTPVVVNAGGWGTFRSRYAPELFARIIGSLDHVTPLERYNLVSDTWAMALSNQADLGEFADLVRMLGKTHEMSSPVWEAALGGLDLMHREIASPVRSGLSEFVARTLGPTFASVGWTPTAEEGAGLNKLRGVLVEALGTIGDDETITARALEMAEAGDVPPDLAGPVMSIVAWNGGPLEYERFWDHVRAAATPQEEIRYLMRLPDFRDPSLLERTLDAVLTDVRSQNGAQVISRSLANRWSGKEAWMWLVKHWDDVVKRLPKNSHGRMLGGIVTLTEPEYVTATADWLRAHPIPSAGKQVDQLLERQRVNAAFGAGHQAALASSFGRSSTGGRSSPATA
jgi:puromycin-sensitive aminopeptidase